MNTYCSFFPTGCGRSSRWLLWASVPVFGGHSRRAWPPGPTGQPKSHTTLSGQTPYSYSSTTRTTHSPSQSLYEHRCHFNGGRAEVTRRWPVGEPRSRWGLSVFNLKLVSGLRNGWYNHICSWSPINSANIHGVAVVSNMKLTIPRPVSGHLTKSNVSLETVWTSRFPDDKTDIERSPHCAFHERFLFPESIYKNRTFFRRQWLVWRHKFNFSYSPSSISV